MGAVTTVAPVHEQVHERACEEEQIGQEAQRVREVFGPQEETDDDQ
jgi:hypothetical protein